MWRTSVLVLSWILSITQGSPESFHRINTQMLNYPDKNSPLYGESSNTAKLADCRNGCLASSECEVFTYNSFTKACYLSTRDPYVLSKGFVFDEFTSIYLRKQYNRDLMYFIFMDYEPPWSDSDKYSTNFDNIESCAYFCLRLRERCRSFAYLPSTQTCATYSKSIILNGKPDSVTLEPKSPTPSLMYFEKQEDLLYYFNPLVGFRIGKSDPYFSGSKNDSSHEKCAKLCLESQNCKSFSIDWSLTCSLSDQIFGLEGDNDGLVPDPQSVYFSMKIRSDFSHRSIFRPQGEITSSQFPNSYPLTSSQAEIVTSPPGTALTAQLTKLALRTNDKTCLDTLIINDIFYCPQPTPLPIPPKEVNDRHQLVVQFRPDDNSSVDSNSTAESWLGYRVGYQWDWICQSTPVSLKASDFEKLSNPGFPSLGKTKQPCKWTITADSGHHVYLSFTNLPKNNVLSIVSDGKSSNVSSGHFGESVTITYAPSTDAEDIFQLYYLQTGNLSSEYAVSTYTDYKKIDLPIKGRHMLLFDRTTLEDENCSIIDIRHELSIKNVDYHTYNEISFKRLGFGHRDWFDECYEGYVDIFIEGADGSDQVAPYLRFCGTDPHSKPILLPNWGETIVIAARLYQRTRTGKRTDEFILLDEERKGFIIFIETGVPNKIIEGREAIQSDSLLARPKGGVGNYGFDLSDLWVITSMNDKSARLNIESAALATIPGKPGICDNDRLDVGQMSPLSSGHTKIKRFTLCGANPLKTTPRLYFSSNNHILTVRFLTDDRHTAKGFNMTVNYILLYPMSTDGKVVSVEHSGYLVSSDYPELIEGKTVSWNITSKHFRFFKLTFESATDDEACKNVTMRSNSGEFYSDCFKSGAVKEFPTGSIVTWTAEAGKPNRLAVKLSYDLVKVVVGSRKGGLTGGAIAGIIISVLAVLILSALLAAYFYFRNKPTLQASAIGRVFFKKDDGTNIITTSDEGGNTNSAANIQD